MGNGDMMIMPNKKSEWVYEVVSHSPALFIQRDDSDSLAEETRADL